MDGAKRFVDRVFHSGGRKPGGDNGQQPDNQQSQFQERDSGKGSVPSTLKSLPPSLKPPEATPKQLPPAMDGFIHSPALFLIPPGQDPVLSSVESQHPPATPHPSTDTTGLGGATVAHVRCSPLPQETASGGQPGISATAIPAPNPPDIVIDTIALVNPSSQSTGPVSTPASDPQTLSTASQAVGGNSRTSDTKTSPSTVPPSISSHLWQKALEIAQESLAKYQLPSVELGSLQSQSASENMKSLVAELGAAHQEKKDRQWRYKDRDGNEVV